MKTLLLALVLGLIASSAAASADIADSRHTFVHDGRTRGYLLRLPPARQPGERLPLVIVLHGGGGNAANAEQMTGFTRKGREAGFIVVYPEGSGRREDRLLTWNARHCCAYAMQNDVDDVGFIRALIDDLVTNYPVDPRRIYATGMSNGGMMTHRLGIELSDRLAAIAPVVATVFGDEAAPTRALPALMINGMLDENVPYLGGPPGGRGARGWDGTPTRPALEQLEFWSKANGCDALPSKQEHDRWFAWRAKCPPRVDVQLYLVKDNGHAWPGGQPGSTRGDTPSTAMDATNVIWAFFAAHPKH
jgi:polyhydroxybutyrate depolymerase